jgi:L-threonylcarbamoyladenylate synthase
VRARSIEVDSRDPSPDVIAEAARVLRAGGLVAFPTETVYGLGARALDPSSVARIFAAKGRPSAHPLIAHVLDEAGARALASSWSHRASRLARAFWPGPLTLVVPRAAGVPDAVAGGGDSIAVRAPAGAIARALLLALGEPVAAPSANRYQSLSPTTAAHVMKSLGDRIDLVLDGGACAAGIESTVVDVRFDRPRVLRPGALDLAALRAVEPSLEVTHVSAGEDAPRPSPGMDPRHYAPRARLTVAADEDAAWAMARAGRDRGERVTILARGDRDGALARRAASADTDVRILPAEPAAYAALLFAALHAADDAGADAILLVAVPDGEEWCAVADRIRRAAEPI